MACARRTVAQAALRQRLDAQGARPGGRSCPAGHRFPSRPAQLARLISRGAVDDLKQLPYTLQVVKETLRLYPAVPIYARDVVAGDTLDGVHIPAGMRVMPFPYATHRHPDFWPNAERFDPDRWTAAAESGRHPYAFHPFAAGKRICLGNSFSLLESHVIAALLVPRFHLRLKPGHRPRVDMEGTIVSKNGMPMFIEPRG